MSMATSQVTETATLVDSSAAPISGKTVTFSHQVSGGTGFVADGSSTTNASGVATFTVSVAAPATYDFQAAFAGDATYKATTATQTALVVKASATITLIVTA